MPSAHAVRRLSRPAMGALMAVAFLLASAAAPAAGAANTAQTAARAVVEGFHAALLEVMKHAGPLGVKGRYERLRPEVERRFNLRLMIAIASGGAWPKASAPERDRLTAAFGRFSAATYAARFDGFSGESFETVSVADGPRGTRLVTTHINRPGDSPIRLVYVTRPSGGAWRIVDVLVDDGISELAVKRSDYSKVLSERGAAGLVAELDRLADTLLAK